MRRLLSIALAAVVTLTVGTLSLKDSPERSTASIKTNPKHSNEPPIVGGSFMSGPDDLGFSVEQSIYDTRMEEEARIERERIEAARLAALEAERARRAAETARVSLPSGPCCGPHSDAWWHGVAMCEQGGKNDPYYGYFSFMDGSQGGRSWDDQVAAGNALLARAGRESPAWAPSCVAAGYNASPSG